MTSRSPLPSVEIRTPYGSTNQWSVMIDGRPIRKVKSITVSADAADRVATVMIEMWAEVVFIGDAQVDITQPQRIAHCGRPHSDEMPVGASGATRDQNGAVRASVRGGEGDTESLRR